MSLALLNRDLAPRGVRAFGKQKDQAPKQSDVLEGLTKFIPTEVLAPYVSFLSYASTNRTPSPEAVYWWFVIATPLLTIFFEYARSAMDEEPWPPARAVVWRASWPLSPSSSGDWPHPPAPFRQESVAQLWQAWPLF